MEKRKGTFSQDESTTGKIRKVLPNERGTYDEQRAPHQPREMNDPRTMLPINRATQASRVFYTRWNNNIPFINPEDMVNPDN